MFNKSKSSNSSKYQKVDIVIPAFNEEESVASVVSVIKQLDYINNIIVVNDGSTDNTHNEAKNAGAVVIDHLVNKGKGAAIKTGVDSSNADIIAFIDADIKNLTPEKVDIIIKPILEGKADITKTKFARESGRVTELTAKPLLKFFFPEVNYEQPLSGQFAGKRSILKKLNFESDYGVDVGIVLDADVRGIKILEVDIGDIEHDMSPLSDLHQMANEVVRTIISRAVNYGRLTMIDSLGNYIRMSILGLSLIILGLFLVFFVQPVPFQLGILIGIIGIIISIVYLIKLIFKSIVMFRKSPANKNVLKSFIKMHFPIIIVFFLLILMISTFMSATTIGDNGQISIEATSRNLVIFGQGSNDHIAVRGPYTVDSAIENESNIIRMPFSAMQTLQMIYGDTITLGEESYTINQTRPGEDNILRLPSSARSYLGIRSGNVISNSRISNVFYKAYVKHTVRASNISDLNYNITENYNISYNSVNATEFDIYIDNQYITSSSAVLFDNNTYYINVNDEYLGSFVKDNLSDNKSIDWNYSNHNIKLINKGYTSSVRNAFDSNRGPFLNFDLSTLNNSVNTTDENYSVDTQQ
ncbi:dolichyl-phosphate-mannose-protein mannosyltransferase [Methanobrevibacter sp. 87.7]|uniref:glycosyltransferase n=1 Tax=Methanobrevibacter sp. 87.7 TaxID=387957 RepID=UPI000B508583|nr:glycosyltransferase [Methanobrevibacter sp. 87.7]OWT33822.1 dolichyl-phosphate-mannose-protein mannosyltransferase [Methanobrevibacter sp. 87.7]